MGRVGLNERNEMNSNVIKAAGGVGYIAGRNDGFALGYNAAKAQATASTPKPAGRPPLYETASFKRIVASVNRSRLK